MILTTLPELVLDGADLGLWGNRGWRTLTYEYGAFWVGLLGNWRPNYSIQPVTMFLSYGFLHAGFWHLALNMATLLILAKLLIWRIGTPRFVALYAVSMLGGAVGFAALSTVPAPMVGASGALFGLVGAMLSLDFRRRISRGYPLAPLGQGVLLLIFVNAVLWWTSDGELAWETHLGGFLTGWVVMLVTRDLRPGEPFI